MDDDASWCIMMYDDVGRCTIMDIDVNAMMRDDVLRRLLLDDGGWWTKNRWFIMDHERLQFADVRWIDDCDGRYIKLCLVMMYDGGIWCITLGDDV